MKLADFLLTSVPFSQEELNDILSHFEKEYVKKNQVLIREGRVCNKLYFVDLGMGRSYYLKKDGKEVTQWFFGAGEFMSSADSFFKQTPSFYYLEILEDSIVYSISNENMDFLLAKYHKMEKFIRLLAIDILSNVILKLNAIQFQTARERYDYMISEFPDISHRVPLSHIASYLGMTQETLSRIRRNDS
ncbi:Crp/Fnr family transcriptional regulator [Gillisia limnaea]|uniref:Putative transcriptional regulator, Crp/Fnr family n=1 Tax=Gillisia limnaea (strain DSM 15749 / LMG 21470 / R-8282) TaxID=865937 RepID=H2BS27_GILLR|nr:Crp/Fnr family transcriptional regulator [Gillisia limnaea]EHQ03553.1 putative transcriptional regulator, Crp/Fnr family [Gillisia limnaea DSM 15749]